jgi:intergrase/recombinase
MKSLTALSKYLGTYEKWKATCKRYNLKWTTGNESIASLARFFNPELSLDSMSRRVRDMMRVLPGTMAAVIRFAALTGLRPSEACESVRLIYTYQYTSSYYNPDQQTLEHFRFPQFLRQTKKAYISYLSTSNYQRIASLGPKTCWNAIRLACRRRNIDMDMRLCRRIFASHLSNCGIQSEIIDFLQGRTSTSVFSRHYLSPLNDLKDRVLNAVNELQKEIER